MMKLKKFEKMSEIEVEMKQMKKQIKRDKVTVKYFKDFQNTLILETNKNFDKILKVKDLIFKSK